MYTILNRPNGRRTERIIIDHFVQKNEKNETVFLYLHTLIFALNSFSKKNQSNKHSVNENNKRLSDS